MLDGIVAPGSTIPRVVSRLVSAGDVEGKAPEFGTRCKFGRPMKILELCSAVSVPVASNGKAG